MKKSTRIFISLFVLVAFIATIGVGCKTATTTTVAAETTKAAETTTTTAAATTTEAPKEFVVGYVPMGFNNPHFEHEKNGVVKALEAAQGIKIKYQEIDGQWDAVKIANAFETLLSQKVNGIIISTFAPETIKLLIEEAKKAGIFVVAADVPIGGEDAAVTTDNLAAGKQAGQYAYDRLQGKGNYVILEMPENTDAQKRITGAEEIFKQSPDLKLLARATCKGDMNTSMGLMENWLQKYKQIDYVCSINDPAALGALAAIEAAKRQEEMFITSVDGYEEGIKAIRDGRSLVAIAQQQPDLIGQKCAEAMIQLLKGEKLTETLTQLPTILITKDTLDKSAF